MGKVFSWKIKNDIYGDVYAYMCLDKAKEAGIHVSTIGDYTYLSRKKCNVKLLQFVGEMVDDMDANTFIDKFKDVDTEVSGLTGEHLPYYWDPVQYYYDTDTQIILTGQKGESANKYITLLNKYNPYLCEIFANELDYEYAKDNFDKLSISSQACTTFKHGDYIARNFDWTYDNSAEFIVRSEGVIGVAGCLPDITNETISSNEWLSDEKICKLLPFFLQDGINTHGLFASVHVVPHYDDYNTATSTTPTESLEETLPALMVVRYILDRFSKVTDAITYLKEHVSIILPQSLINKGYELHWFIGDSLNTYVLEIINGEIVFYEHSILTNFYWHNTSANTDGTLYSVNSGGIKPTEENGLTPNAQGVERYNLIVNNSGLSVNDLVKKLYYSHTYTLVNNIWYSEFTGSELTINNTPSDFDSVVNHAKTLWNNKDRETGIVWHTKHSSVYNILNKTLSLITQDGDDTISKEPISFSLLGDSNIFHNGEGTSSAIQGSTNIAKGEYSIATGFHTVANGNYSHTEGFGSIVTNADVQEWAEGIAAHAEGSTTTASGNYSHAEGANTITNNPVEHAEGQYNVSHVIEKPTADSWGNSGNTIHSVGIGTNAGENRKNAHEIMQNGDHYIYGIGGYSGTTIGGDVKTVQTVISEINDSLTIATEAEINEMEI